MVTLTVPSGIILNKFPVLTGQSTFTQTLPNSATGTFWFSSKPSPPNTNPNESSLDTTPATLKVSFTSLTFVTLPLSVKHTTSQGSITSL